MATDAHIATHHPAIPRHHVHWGFLISCGACQEFPRADEPSLELYLLLVGFPCHSVSSGDDSREVDEVSELVEKPSTTNGT